MSARRFSRRLVLSALSALCLSGAHAESTIKLMVGFPPGGGTDAVARLLAERLREPLGMNVIVENKAGAGGQIAAQALKAAPADGSVLFLSHDHTISILPQVVKTPGFNPATDFTPVAGFATFVNGLALSGGTPAKSFNEYIAWVKTKGKDTVGVPAPASVPEFLVKVMAEKYKLDLQAAPADGSVLFLSHDHSISILPQVVKAPGFNPATDFTPVAGFATFVNGLALSGGTPAKSFSEYIAWGKTKGKDTVGVPAPASVPEFLVKVMAEKYKLDLQAAPYRGSAPMMADMLGKQIAAGTGSVPDFIENHKAGKLRMVAVLGAKRQAILPDVPTFAELGLAGFEDLPYYGIWAPHGTPKAVVDRYSEALAKVLAQPEVKERMTAMGLAVGHMTPQQLDAREKAYTATWARIIQASGFQAQ